MTYSIIFAGLICLIASIGVTLIALRVINNINKKAVRRFNNLNDPFNIDKHRCKTIEK